MDTALRIIALYKGHILWAIQRYSNIGLKIFHFCTNILISGIHDNCLEQLFAYAKYQRDMMKKIYE